jgi:hypothetical protein
MSRRNTTQNAFSVRESLELFVNRAEVLLSSRLILNGFGTSLSFGFDRVQGLTFSSKQPDEELLRSFLLTFRRFISEGEAVFLFRIFNLCQRHLTSENLKNYLIEARQYWSQEVRGGRTGHVNYKLNEIQISPEFITDLWINGYYFHDSPAKLRELEQLLSNQKVLVRHIFLDHLVQAVKFISYTRFIIIVGFREGYFNFD